MFFLAITCTPDNYFKPPSMIQSQSFLISTNPASVHLTPDLLSLTPTAFLGKTKPLLSTSTSLEQPCTLLPGPLGLAAAPYSPIFSTFPWSLPRLTALHTHHVLHLVSEQSFATELLDPWPITILTLSCLPWRTMDGRVGKTGLITSWCWLKHTKTVPGTLWEALRVKR